LPRNQLKENDIMFSSIQLKPAGNLFNRPAKPASEPSVSKKNGQTTVSAGAGNDKVTVTRYADGTASVTINGETTDLTREDADNLVIDAGDGNDDIEVIGKGANGQRLTLKGGSGNDKIQGGAGNETIEGGSGNDAIDAGAGNDCIKGGSGNDKMSGGSGNDHISGGSGNDAIKGGSGNDQISGGSGNDKINAGSGDDRVSGGSGNDAVKGGSGDDQISGGSGNDKISGGSGDDVVSGGSGRDAIKGGSGDDVVKGGSGRDKLSGGSGDDKITGGSGRDEISGGSGDDDIDDSSSLNKLLKHSKHDCPTVKTGENGSFSKATGDSGTVFAGPDNNSVNVNYNCDGTATVTVDGQKFEFSAEQAKNLKVYGGSGDDQIDVTGEAPADAQLTLNGGAGNDFIEGGSGSEDISGGSGEDSIYGGGGDDSITGGSGNDYINTGSAGIFDKLEALAASAYASSVSASNSSTTSTTSSSASAGATTNNNDDGSIDITISNDQTDSPDAVFDPEINVTGSPDIGTVTVSADQSSTDGGTNNASFTPVTNIS